MIIAKRQEHSSLIKYFSIHRMDFKPKIKLQDTSPWVILIELQKIKFHNQSFRFRSYIGNQYVNRDNLKTKNPVPIITIFIAVNHLAIIIQIPAIKKKVKQTL